MANLFNIAEEYLRLVEELEESGGELTDELAARLDITQSQLESKIKAYHHIITLREGEIKVATDEKKRINDRQNAKKNAVDRIKKAIAIAVDLFGSIPPKKSSKALIYDTLSVYNKETESLQILDETLIPAKYITRTVTVAQEDLQKFADLLIKSEIRFGIVPNLLLDNEAIKSKIQDDELLLKELSETEKEERIANGYVFGVPGAIVNKNLSPVFK